MYHRYNISTNNADYGVNKFSINTNKMAGGIYQRLFFIAKKKPPHY